MKLTMHLEVDVPEDVAAVLVEQPSTLTQYVDVPDRQNGAALFRGWTYRLEAAGEWTEGTP